MIGKAYFKEELVRAALDITSATLANDGCTYHIGRGHANKGYAVSLWKERETVIDSRFMIHNANQLQELIELYIKFNLDLLQSDDECHIGTWIDGHQVYLDIVKVIRDFGEAISIAHDNRQIAIYDLEHVEEIRLDKEVGSGYCHV